MKNKLVCIAGSNTHQFVFLLSSFISCHHPGLRWVLQEWSSTWGKVRRTNLKNISFEPDIEWLIFLGPIKNFLFFHMWSKILKLCQTDRADGQRGGVGSPLALRNHRYAHLSGTAGENMQNMQNIGTWEPSQCSSQWRCRYAGKICKLLAYWSQRHF